MLKKLLGSPRLSGFKAVTHIKSLKFPLMMFGSAFVFLLNDLTLSSFILGIPVSLIYLIAGGYSLKRVFKAKQNSVNLPLGVLLLLVLLGLVGWTFTVSWKLGSIEVFVALILVAFVASIVQQFNRNQPLRVQTNNNHVSSWIRFLEGIFVILTFTELLLLLRSRTAIPMTIFDTLNPLVMPILFFNLAILVIILALGEKWRVGLVLILTQSILFHMFFPLVFDAGYGVDQWAALGWSRRLFDESDYPQGVPFSLRADLPGKSLIYQIFKSIGVAFQPTLSTLLSRTFSIDVYWTHLVLVPLLWGMFLPIIAYGVTNSITGKWKLALLSALLTLAAPSLILWGSVSVPNSIGFLLFFFDILLLIDYLYSNRTIFWVFLGSSATMLSHMLPGVAALSLMIFAYGFKNSLKVKSNNARIALQASFLFICLSILPIALLSGRITYPALSGAQFSLERVQGLSPYDAAMLLIVGGYGDLTLKEAVVRGLLPLLGFLGLIYTNMLENRFVRDKILSRFLLFAFASVVVNSRVIEAFLFDVPFGPSRVWVLSDLLAIPFAAIFIAKVTDYLPKSVMPRERSTMSLHIGLSSDISRTIAVLALSALITLSVILGYTVPNPPTTPQRAYLTSNELEAARFIDSSVNERYVVVSYTFFKLAGYAVVGTGNPQAYYSGLYDYGWMEKLFNEVNHGSANGMFEATQVNNASIGFFVTSRLRFQEADQVILSLEDRPDFKLTGVFGDEVYVFTYKPPAQRIVEGIGPSVNVTSSLQLINTTFVHDLVTYQTTYKLELTGLTEYTITGWPVSWSFDAVAPNPTTKSIDANSWVNFTGDAGVKYAVSWASNILYQNVGLKDDSFLTGWDVRHAQGFVQDPIVEQDGDLITLTGDFKKGVREVYWLQKDVGLSTDLYPYVIVRWRSTGTCAISWVYYTDGDAEPIVFYGSESQEWTTSIVRLTPGKIVGSIMVGLDDFTQDTFGLRSAYFDYVMLAGVTNP